MTLCAQNGLADLAADKDGTERNFILVLGRRFNARENHEDHDYVTSDLVGQRLWA